VNRCLLSYDELKSGNYSAEGLRKLNPRLKNLKLFPLSFDEQIQEIQKHAGKISIQGIQPKLSAKLSVKDENFILVDKDGDYIIKPQVSGLRELPQNEDLTMHLAQLAGFDVPWHGLIKAKDDSLLYVIKRFDRLPKKQKLPQEDFAQLMGATRSTKYSSNMEKVCEIVERFASFPSIELEKIFRLTLFSFIVGNEDLHLKNFSLQTTKQGVRKLTPVYDLVNTTIAMGTAEEELALELNEKKKGLTREDFVNYFGPEHCYVPKERAAKMIQQFIDLKSCYEAWIDKSFLSEPGKENYKKLLTQRLDRLK
jgi:serine/threonine-protein kinase HipA